MKSFMALLFVASLVGVIEGSGASWTYDGDHDGPDDWYINYPTCGEGESNERQSPIDIGWADYDATLNDLVFSYSTLSVGQATASNTGHALKLEPSTTTNTLSGSELTENYILAQIHVHWGEDSNHGSEHELQSHQYPMEMHFVHYKASYGSVSNALSNADGLAVVAVMFQVDAVSNTDLTPWFDSIANVLNADETDILSSSLNLNNLLPSSSTTHYYTYSGSLTTPPCSEAVTWFVLKETLSISESQLTSLRTLYRDNGNTLIKFNYRPLQPSNHRTIRASFNCDYEALDWMADIIEADSSSSSSPSSSH